MPEGVTPFCRGRFPPLPTSNSVPRRRGRGKLEKCDRLCRSCAPPVCSAECPSAAANLAQMENHLNIVGRARKGGWWWGGLLSEPHFTCRILRLHAELLRELSLRPASQRWDEVEISSRDIRAHEPVRAGDAIPSAQTR